MSFPDKSSAHLFVKALVFKIPGMSPAILRASFKKATAVLIWVSSVRRWNFAIRSSVLSSICVNSCALSSIFVWPVSEENNSDNLRGWRVSLRGGHTVYVGVGKLYMFSESKRIFCLTSCSSVFSVVI